MLFHDCFDMLFGSKTKVKVLRFMFRFPEKTFTSRELSRYVKVSHTAVLKSLPDLQGMNILKVEKHGTSHILQLNKNFYFYNDIKKLFVEEKDIISELKKIFLDIQPTTIISIFGSIVRKTEKIDSDIDLLVITSNKTEIIKKIAEKQKDITQIFGNTIMPYIMTEKEFKKKRNTALVKNIIKNNIIIKGKILK